MVWSIDNMGDLNIMYGPYNNTEIILTWNMVGWENFPKYEMSLVGATFIGRRKDIYLIQASILMILVVCIRVLKKIK